MEFNLIRKKRKTLSIVIKDGTVTVLAPNRLSMSYIEAFLNKKRDWIEKKLEFYSQANSRFDEILTYKSITLFGKRYEIKPDITVKRIKLTSDALLCPIVFFDNNSGLLPKKDFAVLLKRFVRSIAKKELLKRLENLAVLHGFEFSKFALSDAKSKWGSCDSKKKIMLNTRLVLLDEELIDYVIIHELCHTKICNHSGEFWKEVQKYYPDYKLAKKRLKENSILIGYLKL